MTQMCFTAVVVVVVVVVVVALRNYICLFTMLKIHDRQKPQCWWDPSAMQECIWTL